MFYPLKFNPVYKNMIWGGRNIASKFDRDIPDGNVGESWEICCREDGMSVVVNGEFKGKTLEALIGEYKESLLGTLVYNQLSRHLFPLLIKIIDATDKLSVQVHPDDAYAAKHNDNGKTELWYVLEAEPGASLIYGLKEGLTKEAFTQAIDKGNIETTLNKIPVSRGDVLYIPAGTVHALLDGVMIAEIQQNSNITYRLYDWERVDKDGKPRELHIEDAINVIDFHRPLDSPNDGTYFSVEELDIDAVYLDSADGTRFYIYMVIEGNGTMRYGGEEEILVPGDTVLVPATMGDYSIVGHIRVLKIF